MSTKEHLLLLISGISILLLTLVVPEVLSLDFDISHIFYNRVDHSWLVQKDNGVVRWIFYTSPKLMLGLIWLYLLYHLLLRTNLYSRSALIVSMATMIIIPLFIGYLKTATNMACPNNLIMFNGNIPFKPLFETYLATELPSNIQRCFPAAHAGAGFSLASLIVLFKDRQRQYYILCVSLLLGWVMGLYKMLIGDHFLSHTLVSMSLSLIIVCGGALIQLLLIKRHLKAE